MGEVEAATHQQQHEQQPDQGGAAWVAALRPLAARPTVALPIAARIIRLQVVHRFIMILCMILRDESPEIRFG